MMSSVMGRVECDSVGLFVVIGFRVVDRLNGY